MVLKDRAAFRLVSPCCFSKVQTDGVFRQFQIDRLFAAGIGLLVSLDLQTVGPSDTI